MNGTKYLFNPRSHDRETLPKLNPLALECDAVIHQMQEGTQRLPKGETLTVAKDAGGSHVLAWTEGRKSLVLVEKLDLGEELPWE